MYKTHNLEEYNEVMKLRNKFNWGSIKISSFLLKKGLHIKKSTIDCWLYRRGKPFQEILINKIPEYSKILTEEKAYVLGVLCGDGYVSTKNRIGLSVCDKEFAEFFKLCLERVYELKCSFNVRERRNPNARLQYVVSLVSKRVVEDLYTYLDSFKTKEWKSAMKEAEIYVKETENWAKGGVPIVEDE